LAPVAQTAPGSCHRAENRFRRAPESGPGRWGVKQMKVGIIGLPQTGKTTVFNALTGAHGEVGGYHAGGAGGVAVLKVPDPRLEFLEQTFQPRKLVQATIEFEDIAGIFSHMGPGGEDSAHAVAAARDTEALLMVLRVFPDPTVFHVFETVDPARDFARMQEEMLLNDLRVIENRIEHIERDLRRAPAAEREHLQVELDLLARCREAVEQERGIRAVEMTDGQEKMLRSYAFLTLKPLVCVLNVGEDQLGEPPDPRVLGALPGPPVLMCGQLEMELLELEEEDRLEFMRGTGLAELGSHAVVRACYDALDVRTFFTYAHDEVRAWTVRAGDDAVTAAGKVHTDMAQGFIRAEVVGFDDLRACGSIKEAKAQGKVRLEGRDYEVQDGDVITFRFSK